MPSLRFLEDITILSAIAHHLDHLTPEKIISIKTLKLSEAIHDYLAKHLIAVSRLSGLVPAKFFDEPGEVAVACRSILSEEGKFVPQSVVIAERLFTIMGNNRSLSPGLVLILKVRDNASKQHFVAILKMESQPVFAELRMHSGVDRYIELALNPSNLPSPGKNIQKCALIKSSHSSSEPEILLLDKQARDAAVAGFFHEHFLQAEYCRDSHFRTKKFVKEFVKWANKARQEHRLTPQQLDETIGAARESMRSEHLNVPQFIQENIENRGEQSDCMEALTRRNVDVKFETESKASEKFRKISTIKLDHLTQFRMPQRATLDREFYKVEPDVEDPTLTVITIKTRKYQVA